MTWQAAGVVIAAAGVLATWLPLLQASWTRRRAGRGRQATERLVGDSKPAEWDDTRVPVELIEVEGSGKKSIPDLARLMAHRRAGDPMGVGVTRQEAFKVLEPLGHDKSSVIRAWSRLIDMGYLEPAEGVKAAHLRHLWAY